VTTVDTDIQTTATIAAPAAAAAPAAVAVFPPEAGLPANTPLTARAAVATRHVQDIDVGIPTLTTIAPRAPSPGGAERYSDNRPESTAAQLQWHSGTAGPAVTPDTTYAAVG
jgi:hypothetical protein